MKSLLSPLSEYAGTAVGIIICLIPFAQISILSSLHPSLQLTIIVGCLILACILSLSLVLNPKFRQPIHLLMQQHVTIALIVAWSLLICISNYINNTQYDGLRVILFHLSFFILTSLTFIVAHHHQTRKHLIIAISISVQLIICLALLELILTTLAPLLLENTLDTSEYVNLSRLSAMFSHPNYMAAYMVLTFPFLLIHILLTRAVPLKLLLSLVLCLGLIVLVLSLSRGGIISFCIALALYSFVAIYMQQKSLALICSAMLAFILIVIGLQILITPRAQVRYTSEGSNDSWYRAVYTVPDSIRVDPTAPLSLDIGIRNTGLFTWESEGTQPVNLGYHIICWDASTPPSLTGVDLASLDYLLVEGPRTPLPYDVARGEAITLTTTLNAPSAPGHYLIAWDMIQESVTWFSNKNLVPATTLLIVNGVQDSSACVQPFYQMSVSNHPTRIQIWQTTLQIIRENPLLGIGSGNFADYYRQIHSDDVSIPHAHNTYLSFLVDFGLLSGAFIGLALCSIGRILLTKIPQIDNQQDWYMWFAIALGLTALSLHAIVEAFHTEPAILGIVSVMLGLLAQLAQIKITKSTEG